MRTMQFALAVSALAAAMALSPLAGAQAASLPGPASKVQAGSLTTQVKQRHHRHARHMGGPGRCGENMFWSSKHGHCRDARDKA